MMGLHTNKANINAASTLPKSLESASAANVSGNRPPNAKGASTSVNLSPAHYLRGSLNASPLAPLSNSQAKRAARLGSPASTRNPTFAELPDNFVTGVLQYIDAPALDDALTVSKRFPDLINHARQQTIAALAKHPGRFTQELLPTRLELVGMGIAAPNMRGILHTMQPALKKQGEAQGPLQRNTVAHADLQHAQRAAAQFGGLSQRIAGNTMDIGQCNAQQQSHGFAIRMYQHVPDRKYEGAFASGQLDGLGYLEHANGDRYEGSFADGKQSGQGTYIWDNGACYKGAHVNGEQTGKGTLTFPNGTHYDGTFLNGQQVGRGTHISRSGNRYEGALVNGQRSGEGTYTWPNGACYAGTFFNNQTSGQGTYTSPNGTRYVGKFAHNKIDGYGTCTWPNGAHYAGDFVDNQRTGQGTLTLASGERYEGRFVNGIKTGPGTYFDEFGGVQARDPTSI